MIYILKIFLWLLLNIGVGWAAICVLTRGQASFSRLEKTALAFPLGLGIISLELALSGCLGFHFNLWLCAGIWLPAAIGRLAFRREMPEEKIFTPKKPFCASEVFLLAGIVFQIFYTFVRSLVIPLSNFDAIMNFGIKAKVFYYANTFPPDFYTHFKDFLYNIEYPLGLPLSETSYYLFMGTFDDWGVKVIFPAIFTCMIVFFYSSVLRATGRKTALLFTFLLATVSTVHNFASNGYADIIVAFHFLAAGVLLWQWTLTRDSGRLAVSCIFAMLALWIKAEGAIIIMTGLLVMGTYFIFTPKKPYRVTAGYMFGLFLAVGMYFLFKKIYGLGVHEVIEQTGLWNAPRVLLGNFKRMPTILYEYQSQWFDVKSWNIIWPIGFILIGTNLKKIFSAECRYLSLSVAVIFLGYIGVNLFLSDEYFDWVLSKIVFRFFLHMLPLSMVWFAVLFDK